MKISNKAMRGVVFQFSKIAPTNKSDLSEAMNKSDNITDHVLLYVTHQVQVLIIGLESYVKVRNIT